jgi:hypothetical protein
MHDVLALRARIRAPPGSGARISQRLADALRLAPTEPRLLLVRRLGLGVVPGAAPHGAIQARTEASLAAARARAVHGAVASPGQDAVWFRSEEEARALLLGVLARGEVPAAWFWRLAVPEWQGAPLALWLPRWIAAIRRDPAQEGALARAFAALAADGALRALVSALEDAPAPPAAAVLHATAALPRAAAADEAAADPAPVVAQLPTHVAAGFRAAGAAGRRGGAAAGWIARAALLAVQPSLVAHPTRLAQLARALASAMPDAARHHAAETAQRLGVTPVPRAAQMRGEGGHASVPPRDDAGAAAPPDRAPPAAPSVAPTPRAPVPLQASLLDHRLQSRGGGVFLLVGPLLALGIAEWVSARDAVGFGPALLRDIAARQRMPPDDPLFDLLTPPAEAPDPVALRAWRVGLDRWLWRRVRRRVAEIVRRPGTLALAGDRLVVGFPLAAADLALRRRALDRDPGWQPWLGLALFFRFGEDVA